MYHIGMTSTEQLLTLLNETNNANFTLDDITFGVPEPATPEEQLEFEDPANTKLVITGKPAGDKATIYYDRMELTKFETLAPPHDIVVNRPATRANVLAAFNEFYKSNLVLADIDPETPLPEVFVDDEPVEFRAATGSLAYLGSIVLVITPVTRTLAELLDRTNLDGLVIGTPLSRHLELTNLAGLVIRKTP